MNNKSLILYKIIESFILFIHFQKLIIEKSDLNLLNHFSHKKNCVTRTVPLRSQNFTQQFVQIFRMLTYLPHLLTLVGGRPVVQIRGQVGYFYRNKLSIAGILIAILHCALCIYCDHLSEIESKEQAETFVHNNNILRGSDLIGRLATLLQEPALAVTSYHQSNAFCALLNELEEFDAYLELNVNVKPIFRMIMILDRVICIILVISVLLNYLGLLILYMRYFEAELPFFDYYQNVLPISNYLVHVIGTCVYLIGILIRMNCYIGALKKLDLQGIAFKSYNILL